MNISRNAIVLGSLMLASLGACDTAAEECTGTECGAFGDKEDAPGPDFRRLNVEVVGEGRVSVNDKTCTTAQGICLFDFPVGTVVTVDGDFSFTAETNDDVQEGWCTSERTCRLFLGQSVHLVADLDGAEPDSSLDAESVVPPGIIIDIFEPSFSRFETAFDEGGEAKN